MRTAGCCSLLAQASVSQLRGAAAAAQLLWIAAARALRCLAYNLCNRLHALQIGVGKESDIFEVTNEDGEVSPSWHLGGTVARQCRALLPSHGLRRQRAANVHLPPLMCRRRWAQDAPAPLSFLCSRSWRLSCTAWDAPASGACQHPAQACRAKRSSGRLRRAAGLGTGSEPCVPDVGPGNSRSWEFSFWGFSALGIL